MRKEEEGREEGKEGREGRERMETGKGREGGREGVSPYRRHAGLGAGQGQRNLSGGVDEIKQLSTDVGGQLLAIAGGRKGGR